MMAMKKAKKTRQTTTERAINIVNWITVFSVILAAGLLLFIILA